VVKEIKETKNPISLSQLIEVFFIDMSNGLCEFKNDKGDKAVRLYLRVTCHR